MAAGFQPPHLRMSIALDQVTKRYQDQPVVNDVSIEVGEGEFFVLLGPSGSGKSTLLRAVAGLTGIDLGRISEPAGQALVRSRALSRTDADSRHGGRVRERVR